jgi:betaine-aldehyde dehydrogenase
MSIDTAISAENSAALEIRDPRDGTVVGRVPIAEESAIEGAVATALAAAPAWARVPAAERGQALHRLADAAELHAEELAELNTRETGKPMPDARGGVAAAVGTFRQYAELGPLQRTHSLRGAPTAMDYTRPDPRGLVVALTPWNDPVAVAAGLIGAAVVTGNVVIHKPSERCPHLGLRLGEILGRELPEGVLTTLAGDARVGARLAADPRADVIAHVGSSATGREIAAVAARTGAHTILENGGNDALLVDGDVDPEWAAKQAALGAFANAGQICTSVERIFVHRAIAEPFLAALVAAADRWTDDLGPLVDERMRTSVHAQVSAAVAAGAQLLTGGHLPEGPGTFYPATVLTDVPLETELMTEETFGPVAPVRVVEDFATALDLACADRYGLAATVLSDSLDHITEAVDRLPVGTVKVNAVFGGAPGGAAEPRGASGRGFGYGPELLDEMTTRKVVHVGRPQVRR